MLKVTKVPGKTVEYPVVRRSLWDGIIVLFLSEHRGVVIDTALDSERIYGFILNDLVSCFDETFWEPVNILIVG